MPYLFELLGKMNKVVFRLKRKLFVHKKNFFPSKNRRLCVKERLRDASQPPLVLYLPGMDETLV